MDTIYINVNKSPFKKEIVYKRKIIIHNKTHVLAYDFRSTYRFPGVQGDENLEELVKQLTGLEIKQEDMKELKRIISSYVRYNAQNNKLVPVVREIVRDYYTYYLDLNDEVMEELKKHNNEWYHDPVKIGMYNILINKKAAYNRIREPVKYMWNEER